MGMIERSNEFASVIIAGGRTDDNGYMYGLKPDEAYIVLLTAIMEADYPITEVVTGGDAVAERYAERNKLPLRCFLPDRAKYSKNADKVKTALMVRYAHFLIALWDGKDDIVQNMIAQANNQGIGVHIKFIK